jgi:cytochrome c-type biogenesis protein
MMGSVPAGLAFTAGVVSFLSPCVLPIVPGYLAFVSGLSFDELADPERKGINARAASHAVLFVLGFSAVFVALGASATALGSAVREALPTLQRIGGVVIVLFGLSLLGVVKIPLLMRERRPQLVSKAAGPVGAVVAGVAFGAGWTPCIGPVLASILLFAGMESTVADGTLLLAIYALGLGIPFVLSALFFQWFTGAVWFLRRWLLPLERATGAVLVAMGLLLVSGHFNLIAGFFAQFGQLVDLEV